MTVKTCQSGHWAPTCSQPINNILSNQFGVNLSHYNISNTAPQHTRILKNTKLMAYKDIKKSYKEQLVPIQVLVGNFIRNFSRIYQNFLFELIILNFLFLVKLVYNRPT